MSLTKAQVKKIVLALPLTEEASSYGQPAFKTNGKFLTRLRSEDDSLVLYVSSIDERDHLIEMDPKTFHITDHYKNYPTVLARIERLDAAQLRQMLELCWRGLMPKKYFADQAAGSVLAKKKGSHGGAQRETRKKAKKR